MLPNLGGIDISPVILILLIILLLNSHRLLHLSERVLTWRGRVPGQVAGRTASRSTVRLTPKGGRDAIDGIETLADGRAVLKVRVRAAPSEGEANAALVRLLAKALGVPPRDVTLVAGATARIKRAEHRGAADAAAALEKIARTRAKAIRIGANRTVSAMTRARSSTARRSRRSCAARSRPRSRRLAARRTASCPGSRSCWSATIRRARSMSRNKTRQAVESRHAARSTTACRRPRARPSCSALIARLNADPAVHGILVQLPLPPQIDTAEGDRRDRSGQGRRRLPPGQCRPARARPAGAGALHAARLRDAGQDRAAVARRARGGGDRPLQHRRQAAGAAAARRERHRDGRPFEDPRSAGGVPPRRHAGRRGRPARDGAAATGSSRARP